MDCRILRLVTLKANGQIVCDDSSGYGIVLGEVGTGRSWSVRSVFDAPVYAHVRRSFSQGRPPWPGICETCHTFSPGGTAQDTLGTRIRLMVEPTLACELACPSCMRKREERTRIGSWDLDPAILEAFVRSCAETGIAIEEAHYLGWGEPLLYPRLAELTHRVRRWHPHCIQEATTSGSVDFGDHLVDVDLDRITVSCDGVRQDSYVRYRRGGDIARVFAFFRSLDRFAKRPFVEWKYILFAHNDSDEDIETAQRLATEFGLDSLLFIVTSSKGASLRFRTGNLADFPLSFARAAISPAAALMRVKQGGRIIIDGSALGDIEDATLFVDQVQLSVSDVLEVRGWALRADGRYVDRVECYDGETLIGTTVPRDRRHDVPQARPYAAGPDCGFAFKLPMTDRAPLDRLGFRVHAGNRQHEFSAVVEYGV